MAKTNKFFFKYSRYDLDIEDMVKKPTTKKKTTKDINGKFVYYFYASVYLIKLVYFFAIIPRHLYQVIANKYLLTTF